MVGDVNMFLSKEEEEEEEGGKGAVMIAEIDIMIAGKQWQCSSVGKVRHFPASLQTLCAVEFLCVCLRCTYNHDLVHLRHKEQHTIPTLLEHDVR